MKQVTIQGGLGFKSVVLSAGFGGRPNTLGGTNNIDQEAGVKKRHLEKGEPNKKGELKEARWQAVQWETSRAYWKKKCLKFISNPLRNIVQSVSWKRRLTLKGL